MATNALSQLLGNQAALKKATAGPIQTGGNWAAPQVGPSSAAALKAATPAPVAPAAPAAKTTNPAQKSLARSNYAVSTATPTAATSTVAAAAAPAMSQEDYLAGDSTYQGALAALKQTMAGYQSDYDQNLQKYDTDYNTGLKNLGWQSDGSWNQNDQNTAYGRSYNNQLNDFGARDMLSSSFYGDQLNNLLRQFNDQKSSIDTARGNYRDDQASTLSAETNQNQTAQQQALAEAIARMAAGVSAQ